MKQGDTVLIICACEWQGKLATVRAVHRQYIDAVMHLPDGNPFITALHSDVCLLGRPS